MVAARSVRVVIVAGNRSWSDGRRDVITGSDVVTGQRCDVLGIRSSVKERLTVNMHPCDIARKLFLPILSSRFCRKTRHLLHCVRFGD